MALMADPPLMLLDEPTNGLDPAGVAEIRELITSMARQEGVTVIVSSHILSEIEQMADVVGIICAGSLRYQGPLSGLQDEGVIDFTVTEKAGSLVGVTYDNMTVTYKVKVSDNGNEIKRFYKRVIIFSFSIYHRICSLAVGEQKCRVVCIV